MHILLRRPDYCLCYTNIVFNAVLVFLFFPLLTKAALRFHVQMKSLTTKNPYPPILFRELQILLDHSDQSRTETKLPRSLDQR